MNLFRQIAEAVAQCHECGVVIRDLKLRKFVFTNPERYVENNFWQHALTLNCIHTDTLVIVTLVMVQYFKLHRTRYRIQQVGVFHDNIR